MKKKNVTVEEVPLDAILPSRHQNRRFTESPDDALMGLARSIESQGVIEPVILRPYRGEEADKAFELVAGERRWRAAAIACTGTIPAIVRSLTDDEAAIITVTENMEREDLSPLEEADGVATMLDLFGGDVEAVADKLRVSPPWVAKRARLTHLSGSWRSAAANPESSVSMWAASHLEVVSRMPGDEQEAMYRDVGQFNMPRVPTVTRVEEMVARHLRKVPSAPWPAGDEDLVPAAGSCAACPKRTSRTEFLFEELAGDPAEDRCLDSRCWAEKRDAFLDREVENLAPTDVRVSNVWYGGGKRPAVTVGAVSEYNLKRVPKSKGGVKCLVVDGPNAGTHFYGELRSGAGERAAGRAKPKTMAERREGLERRRWKLVSEQIQYLVDPGRGLPDPPDLATLYRLAAAVGTTLESTYPGDRWFEGSVVKPWDRFDSYAEDEALLRGDLWAQVAPVLRGRCQYSPSVDLDTLRQEVTRIAAVLGDDLHARVAAAILARPEPKSWAKEAPRGKTPPAREKKVARKPKAKTA